MKYSSVVADWRFSPQFAKEGMLEHGDLILQDVSGNKNDLKLITIGNIKETKLKWSEENYFNDVNVKSLEFNNRLKDGQGQYFETVEGSPINEFTFKEGYTIEVIIKLPMGSYDPWMGILTRQGSGSDIGKISGEKEMLTTLSYNDMFQWTSHPLNLDFNPTNWSMWTSEDFREGFHCITIVNDGEKTTLYLNGVTDISNPKEKINGIDFAKGKKWSIGAAEWQNEISGLFSGSLERIRISDKALNKEAWLVPDPIPTIHLTGTNSQSKLLQNESNYNFVFIPDSQYMEKSMPEMVSSVTEWIANNSSRLNVKIALHLGDVTEDSIEEQYMNAANAFDTLDKAGMCYLVTPGNHDLKDDGVNFGKFFSDKRYKSNSCFRKMAEDNYSLYGIMEAGSYKYLFISLDYSKLEDSIIWAQNIINNNKNIPTIVFTHDAYNFDSKGFRRTINGEQIWSKLVNENNQIFMVAAGHEFNVAHRISENKSGNSVIELLVNYQSYPYGGNGWIRLAEFDENKNIISFKTYSPWVDKIPLQDRTYYDLLFLNSERDEFAIELDFKKRFNFVK